MKNFSLSLYAFHLHHTLTELPGEVDADANLLWENLVKLGETVLPFMGLKDLRSKLICYDNNKYHAQRELGKPNEWLTHSGNFLDLGSFSTQGGFKINAHLQPFLINDTYAADLTLFPESANTSIDVLQLEYFQPGSLLPSHIQPSLGQTFWIYGEVDATQDCDTLAKNFATALVAGTNLNPVQKNKDELFGSILFQYQANDPNEPNNSAKQCHILIVINNQSSPTIQLAGNAYNDLRDLLCCYHKICYIYYQARQRYFDARGIYSYLDQKIQEFNNLVNNSPNQLSDLKKLLAEIPQKSLDYARCLQDLQTHQITIRTNIYNYRICLEKITSINNQKTPQFWQSFINKDCKKWQKQVQTDINYLAPGQELFGRLVDTIRGVIETQQAEIETEQMERTVL